MMPLASTLKDRYLETIDRVRAAAARAGADPDRIITVAVTKYTDPESIRELIHLGHRDFGESRVQQLVQRAAIMDECLDRERRLIDAGVTDAPALPNPGLLRWHMIGRIQRNKVKKAVETAKLIHSVDSLRVAEEIQTAAVKRPEPVNILLQINASDEPQKGGVALPAARHVADQIATMVNVHLRGLMTMAALTDDEREVRRAFSRARECFDELKAHGVGRDDEPQGGGFNILSMGMSNDFEIAIEEGSNVVRVGSAIFGDPPHGHDEPDDDPPSHND